MTPVQRGNLLRDFDALLADHGIAGDDFLEAWAAALDESALGTDIVDVLLRNVAEQLRHAAMDFYASTK